MTSVISRRESVSPHLRKAILERDNYTCRYCGSKTPPFHLDHVYPFSKGGETSSRNLVTACEECNHRKYNRVGIYPKPIGYFEREKLRKVHLFMSPIILGFLITIIFWMAIAETDLSWKYSEIFIGLICWIPILKELIPIALGEE